MMTVKREPCPYCEKVFTQYQIYKKPSLGELNIMMIVKTVMKAMNISKLVNK